MYPNAHIYAFEPLASTAATWEDWAKRHADRVTLGVQALGEREGVVPFWEHVRHPSSSSILQRTEKSVELYPKTEEVRQVTVPLMRLDDAMPLDPPRGILVKMDCQGYEGHIIEGGVRTFEKAYAVVSEIMIEPLYDGQATFDDLVACFAKLGLSYRGNVNQERGASGKVAFIDAVFVREGE
jgi:FkbM family methyltransferase